MKLSLEQLKEERLLKIDAGVRLPTPPRPILKPRIIVKNDSCRKHNALHLNCAKIGARRTKLRRWHKSGERLIMKNDFISENDLDKIEKAYETAKALFHKEPCTCDLLEVR